MIDRYITTRMSANIVAALIKSGWTETRIASAIKAPPAFIGGVRAKRQVLSFDDIGHYPAERYDEDARFHLLAG